MPILNNPKHEKFCLEYATSGNQTRAYIAAGYSETGANANAARLIAKDGIRRRITELQAKQERKAIDIAAVDAAYVLNGLRQHAERGLTDPEHEQVSVRALELLGRHLKMFTDRVETSSGESLEDLSPAQLDKLYERFVRSSGTLEPENLSEPDATRPN